jgi:hypothetical protein
MEPTIANDPRTDSLFLDAEGRLSESDGPVLITVPANRGNPSLHRDSLGFFIYQREYGKNDRVALSEENRFGVAAMSYFRFEEGSGWLQASEFAEWTTRTLACSPSPWGARRYV